MDAAPTLNWAFIAENWPLLAKGFVLDIAMALVGTIATCLLGLVLQRSRASHNAFVSKASYGFIQVTMGVPFYVLLLWLYAGLASLEVSAISCTIIALALTDCGKTAEIYRGGFSSIDPGQLEAAEALGMGPGARYRDILLPQVIRVVAAPLGNIFIGQIKGATVSAVIAVPEMVFHAQELSVNYFQPFEAFGTVAAVLVVTVLAFSGLLHAFERSLRLP